LLTDIVLPDIRGDEVAKRVLKQYPELKVLYMSGYVDRDFGEFNIDETVAFLQKPFSPDALTSKVRTLLDSR
jgi:DNA-binding NtrC family response regulator